MPSGTKTLIFFHSFASAKKRKNEVARLRDDNRTWCTWNHGHQDLIVDYFKDVFTSRGSDNAENLSNVNRKITEEHNQYLLRLFDVKEVREAVFSMHPNKSPRTDGMSPGFFQAYWGIPGEEVIRICMKCLNDCQLPEGMNSTFIVLILKKSRQERISELRPISLCNVVYKIMAKVLTNRLKKVLPSVISESQSAFVLGSRLITNNIMTFDEVNHHLKRKRQGKHGTTTLKIDMSKAYDRVEWSFLRDIMLRLSFHHL